jgi:hypothetical protein
MERNSAMRIHLSRRIFLGSMLGIAVLPLAARLAKAAPAMIVHRDPNCGCCEHWVAHVRAAGIDATIVNEADMTALKTRLRVPDALVSCHTAEIGGYVVEGHVPAKAVLQLLRDRPDAFGLAAPGMPAGSPGMETGGAPEAFEVMLFGANGTSVYGRYRGGEAV